MALPEPAAQGDLAKTPFAHVLVYAAQRRWSGSLAVWPKNPQGDGGQDRIALEDGVIVRGRLMQTPPHLDRGLLPLFVRDGGVFAFYEGVDLIGQGSSVLVQNVDPWMLITASLRGPSRDDIVDQVLRGYAGKSLRLVAGSDFKRLQLLPKEAAFLDILRAAPSPVRELLASCELGEQAGKRLIYLLTLYRAVEEFEPSMVMPLGGVSTNASRNPSQPTSPGAFAAARSNTNPGERVSPRPSFTGPTFSDVTNAGMGSGTAARMPLPPSMEKDEPPALGEPPESVVGALREFWVEIQKTIPTFDEKNFFEILGVAQDAAPDAIRKAYFALVKKWHPDRLPKELPNLKLHIDYIFHLITEAHDTLIDEKKRVVYTKQVSEGGGTPLADRKLKYAVAAAMDHQKAEVLIRRRDFTQARLLLERAKEMNPEDPDVLVSYAWVLFQTNPAADKTPVMLEALERAIALGAENDKSHYYRGMILRRAGRDKEALVAFKRAFELNPKNIDAAREVRLADMRGQSSEETSSSSSKKPSENTGKRPLFGGIFSGGKKDEKSEPGSKQKK